MHSIALFCLPVTQALVWLFNSFERDEELLGKCINMVSNEAHLIVPKEQVHKMVKLMNNHFETLFNLQRSFSSVFSFFFMHCSLDLPRNFYRLLKNPLDFLYLIIFLHKKHSESRKGWHRGLKACRNCKQRQKKHSKE